MLYTTKDLAEGRIVLAYTGDAQRLKEIIKEAFPHDIIPMGVKNEELASNYYYRIPNNNGYWGGTYKSETVPSEYKDVPWLVESKILLMSEVKKEKKKDVTASKPIQNRILASLLPPDLQEAINTLGSYGIPIDIEISINGKKIAP